MMGWKKRADFCRQLAAERAPSPYNEEKTIVEGVSRYPFRGRGEVAGFF